MPEIFFFFQSGQVQSVVHIGRGVVINEEDFDRVEEMFSKAWPYDYGSKSINSKSDLSVRTHMDAYDTLIFAVWPSYTHAKYYALEGFPRRADFHRYRVEVCVGELVPDITYM